MSEFFHLYRMECQFPLLIPNIETILFFRDGIDWIICVVCWLAWKESRILLSSCCCCSFQKQHDCIHSTSMTCAESILALSEYRHCSVIPVNCDCEGGSKRASSCWRQGHWYLWLRRTFAIDAFAFRAQSNQWSGGGSKNRTSNVT